MEFEKLSTPSLKELFVTQLEEKILSGELKIGEKLPSERELANTMQVSRAVVNAGLVEMQNRGFITIKPRIGAYVADYRQFGTMDTLISILRHNGGKLANNEIISILQLRSVLTGLAVGLILENKNPDAIDLLEPYMEKLRQSKDVDEMTENIYELYHQFAIVSGNVLLPLIFVSFKELICNMWKRYLLSYGMKSLLSSTEELYDLIKKGDTKAIDHLKQTSLNSISGDKPIF